MPVVDKCDTMWLSGQIWQSFLICIFSSLSDTRWTNSHPPRMGKGGSWLGDWIYRVAGHHYKCYFRVLNYLGNFRSNGNWSSNLKFRWIDRLLWFLVNLNSMLLIYFFNQSINMSNIENSNNITFVSFKIKGLSRKKKK